MTVQGPPYICTTMVGQHVPSAKCSWTMYTFREVDEVFLIFSRLTMMSPSHRWGFPALIDCCVFKLTMTAMIVCSGCSSRGRRPEGGLQLSQTPGQVGRLLTSLLFIMYHPLTMLVCYKPLMLQAGGEGGRVAQHKGRSC